MRSKRDFVHEERVGGRGLLNVVEGLELHAQVVNEREQGLLQAAIESWVARGRQVRARPLTPPHAPMHTSCTLAQRYQSFVNPSAQEMLRTLHANPAYMADNVPG